jgi:histone demethylase JARID1
MPLIVNINQSINQSINHHRSISQVNCCEAVNFAPADWLPWGSDAVARYRTYHRMPVFSQDELVLLWFVCACNHFPFICAKWPTNSCCSSSPGYREAISPEGFSHVLTEVQRIRNSEKFMRSRLRDAQKAGMLVVRCSSERIDSLKDRNCVICNHQLYLSGVTCECSPGKVSKCSLTFVYSNAIPD